MVPPELTDDRMPTTTSYTYCPELTLLNVPCLMNNFPTCSLLDDRLSQSEYPFFSAQPLYNIYYDRSSVDTALEN